MFSGVSIDCQIYLGPLQLLACSTIAVAMAMRSTVAMKNHVGVAVKKLHGLAHVTKWTLHQQRLSSETNNACKNCSSETFSSMCRFGISNYCTLTSINSGASLCSFLLCERSHETCMMLPCEETTHMETFRCPLTG